MDYDASRRMRKKSILLVVILIIATLLTLSTKVVLEPRYTELRSALESTSTLAKDISAAEAVQQSYEESLLESGKVFSDIVTGKDAYVSYLGDTTLANQLKVNKMTVADVENMGSKLYSMKVALEVQGNLYNVKNFIQQLYDSEVVSRINTFSYRLQAKDSNGNQLQWMWRAIDNRTLVGWWNLQGATSSNTTTSSGQDMPLTANNLLEHGTALCYMEVEFIGTRGG